MGAFTGEPSITTWPKRLISPMAIKAAMASGSSSAVNGTGIFIFVSGVAIDFTQVSRLRRLVLVMCASFSVKMHEAVSCLPPAWTRLINMSPQEGQSLTCDSTAFIASLRNSVTESLTHYSLVSPPQSASQSATALPDKRRDRDPKAPVGSRSPQDLLCAEPANRFEANFANSFSVPNRKSLFSFITLRKKWFQAANFDRNSDTGKTVGLISLPSARCAGPSAETGGADQEKNNKNLDCTFINLSD